MSLKNTHWYGASNPVGEPFITTVPKDFVAGSKPGVIFCHAAQEDEAPWFEPVSWAKNISISVTAGSATVTSAGLFGAGTDGFSIQGYGIPVGTYFDAHSDTSHATMKAHVNGVAVPQLATATANLDGTSQPLAVLGGKYQQLYNAIAQAGYPVGSTYMGGDLWGNDTAIAFIEALRAHLVNTVGAANPILMVGTSMGGLSVYCYMRAHPTNVKGAVLVCPVSDITAIAGGFQTEINAAYGGTYSDDVYGALHNPIDFCTLLADTPLQLWVADDDATANPVLSVKTINAFHQAEVHHMLGGHNNLNDMDISLVTAWMAAHA